MSSGTQTDKNRPAEAAEIHSELAARSRQGVVVECGDDAAARAGAIDAAFDYRGDVTLRLADGSEVTGYVSNRDAGRGVATMYPVNEQPRDIAYGQIVAVSFSGRDPAAGHTWEAWLKRYVEKKASGESASLESEHQG